MAKGKCVLCILYAEFASQWKKDLLLSQHGMAWLRQAANIFAFANITKLRIKCILFAFELKREFTVFRFRSFSSSLLCPPNTHSLGEDEDYKLQLYTIRQKNTWKNSQRISYLCPKSDRNPLAVAPIHCEPGYSHSPLPSKSWSTEKCAPYHSKHRFNRNSAFACALHTIRSTGERKMLSSACHLAVVCVCAAPARANARRERQRTAAEICCRRKCVCK